MTPDAVGEPERRGDGLVLVGYRGTGKSTVGRLLAARLGWPFVDADAALTARAGQTVAALFAMHGESGFRDREAATLADHARGLPLVLATGGGAVLRLENRQRLRRHGRVVWLTAAPAVLAARLSADQTGPARPALTARGTLDEIATVLAERTPLYRSVADLAVATDGLDPPAVVAAVLAALPATGFARPPAIAGREPL